MVSLRSHLARVLQSSSRIACHFGRRIKTITRKANGFSIEGRDAIGNAWQEQAPVVVNALWDGRLALDCQLGYRPDRPWVYRLKHRVLAKLPSVMRDDPSVSFVLGAYGDLVTRPAVDELYISWYPTCLGGWSSDLVRPDEWEAACTGTLSAVASQAIARKTLAEFAHLVPALRDCEVTAVDGGVIFSWGEKDIDHADSELHQRHDVGVHSYDGYFSIDTAKITTAPLFAQKLVARI